jgi:carbohydrate-binding DOMON domain-containing protein
MTDITINGTTYSVDIQHTVHTGYSGGLANVDGANRLPTFAVIANVNGVSTTIDVSFAGHHVINYATVTSQNNASFLEAIRFDGLSYGSNVIPLPDFAPGNQADEVAQAISS